MDQRWANSWRMTVNEKKFIKIALLSDLRVDGRPPFDYRRITIKFGSKDGSAEVQLGQTHVMGYVTSQLVQPYRDRPNEGTLSIFTEFSPMADPAFEAGRPGESAIELGRVIDRGLRESRAVDMESLCVIAGKSVWAIRVDLHILDNGGNLIDAANIAALAALLTFRRPECTLDGENGQDVTVHDPEVREPLPLIVHHLPVAVTFAFFSEGNIMVIDPTHKEEAVMGGRMTATLNSNGDICAVQKAGGEGIMSSVVMQCLRIASVKAADITSKIKNAVDAYNTERSLKKVKRHSAPVAQSVSVPDVIMKENQVNDFKSPQDKMLEDEPERYSTGINSIQSESSSSHKQDGNSIGKAFIGGPSNWDPYSKGISLTSIRAQTSLGIPNDWPFKEQELKALEARRARALEELEQKKAARKERAQKRKLGLLEVDGLANLASSKDQEFENRSTIEETSAVAKSHDHSERSFYKELVKVIEVSDVILEVLDARDPLGTRCPDLEKMIYKSDPNKRLVLLLNKIDLVPREAVEKWLNYLRGELPAVAFKCSTQQQRTNLGWKSSSKTTKPSNILQTSDCLGAETLIKLLKNYSRSHELKVSITVGIVGLPNVGKSSLINSLKRSHVVNVGATPGLTRSMQEIQLDKNVKLLDCPGVVMLKSGDSDASVALRNCKRIEKLDDPVGPVKEILKLCPADRLISLYKLPSFSTVDDFLQKVATIRGKLKKGGIVDIEAAARIVLHDWNEGKIPYYTLPPTRNVADLETTIVSEFSKEFDVDEVYKNESSFIGNLVSVEDFRHVVVPPSSPLNFDEQMIEEDNVEPKETNQMDDEPMAYNEEAAGEEKPNSNSRQNEKLYSAEGILDPQKKRVEKKRRKAQKQALLNQMDADYDFKVDYQMKDKYSDFKPHDDDSDGGDDDADEVVPMPGDEVDA